MPINPLEITGGIAIGEGVGLAIGDVVRPKLQDFANTQWTNNPHKPLAAQEAAALLAQGADSVYASPAEALNTGIAADRFAALVYLASTAPGTAETLELWRRGQLSPELARKALRKAGLLPEFIDPVLELFNLRLDPVAVAVMVQRGILPNSGLLPVGPPTETGKVPPMPQVDIDPVKEAQAHGFDRDRIAALARIVGLPASPDLAARMVFRQIIDRVDFDRAIAEGNTRNEWAPFLFDGFREILTANQYAELELRGYYDRATRLANTAKHGMSEQNSDWLYDVLGRSVPVRAVTTGLARGGTYPGTYAAVPEPYRAAIQRSNIREEYAELAYANRYTYPSGFQIRHEAQTGALTRAETEELLLEIGWSPKWAAFFAEAWTGGVAVKADKHVGKAQEQLWTAAHRSYVAEESDDAVAQAALAALGVAAPVQPQVLALWQQERTLIRRQLTPAQVRTAYKKVVENPATGQPWTHDDALTALLDRGYSHADATTFLEE